MQAEYVKWYLCCIVAFGALLVFGFALAPGSAARTRASTPPASVSPAKVPGEVLVRFTPDSSTARRHDSLTAAGSDEVEPIEGISRARRVSLEPGQTVKDALDQLRARDEVAWAAPNRIGHVSAIPDDPGFDLLWAEQNTGQPIAGTSGTPGADIGATSAWDLSTGDPSTRVAVVDTGVDPANPDIAPNLDRGLSRNFTASVTTGITSASDWIDENGHGTHVAGTIAAAGNNGIGVTGVSWKADLIALRACGFNGFCDTASVASALAYAGQIGARVVNVSLGFAGNGQDSSALRNAIAAHPRTLYLAAAGNEGVDNEQTSTYPCDLDLDNVICVAATGQNDELADFSNYGSRSVDLAAPGVKVLSTVPDIVDRIDGSLPDGLTGWSLSSPSDWSLATQSDGNRAITYQASGATASIVTPSLDFSGADRCSLHYLLKARLNLGQNFYAQISTDNGNDWRTPPGGGINSGSGLDPNEFAEIDNWLGDMADGHSRVKLRFLFVKGLPLVSDPSIEIESPSATCVDPQPPGGTYDYYSGTSMATPQVAGAATLLFSDRPDLGLTGARQSLLDSVDPLAGLSGKTVTGGRLDAARALVLVDRVDRGRPAPPSNRFSVKRVRRLPGGGAILRVRVPGSGKLRIFGTRRVRGSSREVHAAGVIGLRLRPRGKARRRLRHRGWVRVRVKLGYRPGGGTLRRHHRSVKLVKRRR